MNPLTFPSSPLANAPTRYIPHQPFQTNRHVLDKAGEISLHDHSGSAELVLVTHGYGYHYAGSTAEEAKRGTVFFIPPSLFHCFYPADRNNSTRLAVLNCTFSKDFFQDIQGTFPQLDSFLDSLFSNEPSLYPHHFSYSLTQKQSAAIKPMLESLEHFDIQTQRDIAQLTLAALLLQIQHNVKPSAVAEPNPIVQRTLEYIHTHYKSEAFTFSALYQWVFASKSHICTLFRKHTGVTPMHYLNQLRIQEACRLLRHNTSPHTVYKHVGYKEYNTFYVNFKKITGFNLRDYQKAISALPPETSTPLNT